jgi:hypothetical protein
MNVSTDHGDSDDMLAWFCALAGGAEKDSGGSS